MTAEAKLDAGGAGTNTVKPCFFAGRKPQANPPKPAEPLRNFQGPGRLMTPLGSGWSKAEEEAEPEAEAEKAAEEEED